jgi:HSP20 family protein
MDPWPEIQRLQQEMNRIFSSASQPYSHEFPAINAWAGEEGMVVTAELPGADPEKLDISVVGDSLTVSGNREAEALKDGESYHRQERSVGRFTRTIQLPFHVDTARVAATYERGILNVVLPRSEAEKPKKISIKS